MSDKLVSLNEAIENDVKEGMAIHISLEAGAATRGLARQFWGRKAGFTLIMNMLGGHHALSLLHGGLVKKLIFSNSADIYPRPYPNAVIQRAFKNKSIKLENWSLLSWTSALMAGALNLPFMPTRSIMGSSLADDNSHAFSVMEDVFGSGERIGLVKSLRPDISIIHGWAADSMGNAIVAVPPRDAWGAKASRNGVILTVEKLVSEDFIRRHSLLVKIPGSLVNAVCVEPFGAHPQNMNSQSLPEFEGYGSDHEFLKDFRKATEDSNALDAWVKKWILDCPTHEDYLDQLGGRRICELKTKGSPQIPSNGRPVAETKNLSEKEPTPAEYAIIGGARKIKDIIQKNHYKTMFAGIGISGLAGWCAYYFLKEEGYHIDLLAAGIGYEPCPNDPLLISPANIATSKMISDCLDVHGVSVGGINSRCLGVLGAGQIDKNGNINSTKIKSRKRGDIYLSGAGGGNDIASGARESVVVVVNKGVRLVERVPYITCPGKRISTLITNEGIYVKDGSEFILKGYFPKPELSDEKERIQEISIGCGWELRISAQLEKLCPPTLEELSLLRSFDPDRVFLG